MSATTASRLPPSAPQDRPAAAARGRPGGRPWRVRCAGLLALCSLMVLGAASPAGAQPQVAETGSARRPTRPAHAPLIGARPELPVLPAEYLEQEQGGIRFSYHPSARDRVRPLIDSVERVRHELRAELSQPVLGTVDIRVAMTVADASRIMPRMSSVEASESAAAAQGQRDPRLAGASRNRNRRRPDELRWRADAAQPVIAFAELSLLVMNLGTEADGAAPDGTEALRHGLAHLALDEATGSQVVPRWFHEGYATRFAVERSLTRSSSLGWAALTDQLVPVRELDWYLSDEPDSDHLSNAQAADFVRFLLDADELGTFSRLVLRLKSGEPYRHALPQAYGADQKALEQRWRRNVAWRAVYLPVLAGGVILAALVALGWRLRSRWRRRRGTTRRPFVRTQPARTRRRQAASELSPTRVTVKVPAPEISRSDPPDSGVPKVSHNGSWHTLH